MKLLKQRLEIAHELVNSVVRFIWEKTFRVLLKEQVRHKDHSLAEIGQRQTTQIMEGEDVKRKPYRGKFLGI